MMAGQILLDELRRLGATITESGGNLRLVARRGVLTPDFIDALRAHKAELLAFTRSTRNLATDSRNGRDRQLDVGECLEALAGTFALLRANYESNAVGFMMDHLPELAERFRRAEERVEGMCGARPTEFDLRAALGEYEAVIREACARLRAVRERQLPPRGPAT